MRKYLILGKLLDGSLKLTRVSDVDDRDDAIKTYIQAFYSRTIIRVTPL